MMETRRLVEKLSELDHISPTRDNHKILAFASEAGNCLLELKDELQEIDRLRERIERLEAR